MTTTRFVTNGKQYEILVPAGWRVLGGGEFVQINVGDRYLDDKKLMRGRIVWKKVYNLKSKITSSVYIRRKKARK
jgi:hypothetical protein